MKNTELRIGNLITGIYDGDDEKEAICEVLAVDATQSLGEGWSIMVDSDESAECFDDFKPILLTEEWLLKLGFRKFVNDFSLKGVVIHSRKRGYVIRKSIPVMTSVHMLQNYFYAATGQELLIDQITIK